MIRMNYDHNKKFGLLKFYSGYGKNYFNSPKGYSQKIINVQTVVPITYGRKFLEMSKLSVFLVNCLISVTKTNTCVLIHSEYKI